MKCLGRLLVFILLAIALIAGIFYYIAWKNDQADVGGKITVATASPDQVATVAATELIVPPAGFQSEPGYVVPPGTEIKGVGVVDKGFAFVGTEKVEFVTGYTLTIPNEIGLGGLKVEIRRPELILDLALLGLKSVGVKDREELTGVAEIGDESTGVKFNTTWNETKLQVEAIVFRKGNTGALAAVIYADGQTPSVSVAHIAQELEEKIASEK